MRKRKIDGVPEAKHNRGGYNATRNSALLVKWEQDINSPAGIGLLLVSIPRNGEEYRLSSVPRKYYMDLLRRTDPETLFNQILTMYLVPEVKADTDDYMGEF